MLLGMSLNTERRFQLNLKAESRKGRWHSPITLKMIKYFASSIIVCILKTLKEEWRKLQSYTQFKALEVHTTESFLASIVMNWQHIQTSTFQANRFFICHSSWCINSWRVVRTSFVRFWQSPVGKRILLSIVLLDKEAYLVPCNLADKPLVVRKCYSLLVEGIPRTIFLVHIFLSIDNKRISQIIDFLRTLFDYPQHFSRILVDKRILACKQHSNKKGLDWRSLVDIRWVKHKLWASRWSNK